MAYFQMLLVVQDFCFLCLQEEQVFIQHTVVSSVVHSIVTHSGSSDSYVRLLFLDCSSAFNTITP